MKKIIASLIICIFILSLVPAICITAAETNFTVWEVGEIQLTSTKSYSNPYSDVTIDATFTHTDGTQITMPGFWKKDNVFAVRFAPTKTGTWSYTITSSDTSNSSLKKSGTIKANANTGSSNIDKHGYIRISATNRYFEYTDGTPFFWLGDTNWQAPNYVQTDACNFPGCTCKNQFKHEVDNRVSKGFNVYQTYFDSGETDGGGQRGKVASIWTTRHTLPNAKLFEEKIDYMFDYLQDKGMTVVLGLGVHSSTMKSFSQENYLRFVRYIVARYGAYNVMWMTGQEITDTEASVTAGKTVMDVYLSGAELTEKLDGYNHPNSAHMYPMDYNDARAQRLENSSWHDFWMLQSGHSENNRDKSFYSKYYYGTKTKPVIESEANYEEINCGRFTGYDASRISAWHAVVSGSAGFTYGVSGIWANCYSNEGNTGWLHSYSYEPWFMTLDKPGSYEVMYMKNFFEALPDWTKLIPTYTSADHSDFGQNKDKSLAITADKSTAVCYFVNSDRSTGKLTSLVAGTYTALWYNPRTGAAVDLGQVNTGKVYSIPQKPDGRDWVFLLTKGDTSKIRRESAYTEVPAGDIKGEIATPVKVTAPGGKYYSNNRLVDNTALLFDGNTNKAWTPYSQRVTQTFIFDMGQKRDMTYITVTPDTNTVLPDYRIEGSVDGKSWTIIKDSTVSGRRNNNKNEIVENLKGSYRYVKLLLLNPVDLKSSVTYKTASANGSTFSYTAISEIKLYAEKIVATPSPTSKPTNVPTPEVTPDTTPDTAPDTTPDETPAVTPAPSQTPEHTDEEEKLATPIASATEEVSADTDEKKSVVPIGIGIGAAAFAVAVVCVIAIKKRKK